MGLLDPDFYSKKLVAWRHNKNSWAASSSAFLITFSNFLRFSFTNHINFLSCMWCHCQATNGRISLRVGPLLLAAQGSFGFLAALSSLDTSNFVIIRQMSSSTDCRIFDGGNISFINEICSWSVPINCLNVLGTSQQIISTYHGLRGQITHMSPPNKVFTFGSNNRSAKVLTSRSPLFITAPGLIVLTTSPTP